METHASLHIFLRIKISTRLYEIKEKNYNNKRHLRMMMSQKIQFAKITKKVNANAVISVDSAIKKSRKSREDKKGR